MNKKRQSEVARLIMKGTLMRHAKGLSRMAAIGTFKDAGTISGIPITETVEFLAIIINELTAEGFKQTELSIPDQLG